MIAFAYTVSPTVLVTRSAPSPLSRSRGESGLRASDVRPCPHPEPHKLPVASRAVRRPVSVLHEEAVDAEPGQAEARGGDAEPPAPHAEQGLGGQDLGPLPLELRLPGPEGVGRQAEKRAAA